MGRGGIHQKITARKPRKRRKRIDPRNLKLVRALAKGMSKKAALEYAGLSSKNPGQSTYQAIKTVERHMPEVLDKYGLTAESLVRDFLKPLMESKETKFFPYRTEEEVEPARVVTKDEAGAPLPNPITIPAVTRMVQKIETREVVNWSGRRDGLDMALRIGGHYAADNASKAPQNNIGVRVVMVGVPRPGGPSAAPQIEVQSNGHTPGNGNGQ